MTNTINLGQYRFNIKKLEDNKPNLLNEYIAENYIKIFKILSNLTGNDIIILN